jgi:hypothetical protein
MFTRNRVTPRERCEGRNNPLAHSVLAVFTSKEPRPSRTAMDGVSTYLALTFGTLLSSQGTDASFVLTLSGFPPGASLRSCCLAFPTLSDLSDPISSVLSRFPLSRFPFRRFRLYQILSGSDSPSEGVAVPAVGPFRRGETVADSRRPKLIGAAFFSNVDSSFCEYIH